MAVDDTKKGAVDRSPPRVFIVHGRDIQARDELVKFIRSLGWEWLSFHDASVGLGASPFITEIIRNGIAHASATIALFTPDEQAALYLTEGTLADEEEQPSRWQARPNVIFEAGLALGVAGERTVLVTMGADVRLFSNVGGKRIIELDNSVGKAILRQQLEELIGPATAAPGWETLSVSGDFDGCIRRRWPYYDELTQLEAELGDVRLGKDRVPVLQVIRTIVEEEPKRNWAVSTPRRFMDLVDSLFPGDVTEDTYWWLLVHGFFRFDDIKVWWYGNEESWDNSVDYAVFARRGTAFLEKLKRLRPTERDSTSRRVVRTDGPN
ncbi:MAG TPA: TIR domain-containing protein [Longimicrobium sp.]|nr:TIR domain-containing protein [Longimicrobium sp.]